MTGGSILRFTILPLFALFPGFQELPGKKSGGEYDEESEERDDDDYWKEFHVAGKDSQKTPVSVHTGCRPRRSRLYLYATRTMQGRRPVIGNEQNLWGLQRAMELNSHRSCGILKIFESS